MAGRIQFDRDVVVDAALKVFWIKGFTRTSMEDVKKATGINESSLYNTFGNKESLFKEALDTYRGRIMEYLGAMPNLEHPRETLETLLREIGKKASELEGSTGCMIMNCAMEIGQENAEIAEYAQTVFRDLEEWFFVTVSRGQELGEISGTQDARVLARFLVYNMRSLITIGRTSPSKEFMEDVVETALSVL